jgi:hypothetical protein
MDVQCNEVISRLSGKAARLVSAHVSACSPLLCRTLSLELLLHPHDAVVDQT